MQNVFLNRLNGGQFVLNSQALISWDPLDAGIATLTAVAA